MQDQAEDCVGTPNMVALKDKLPQKQELPRTIRMAGVEGSPLNGVTDDGQAVNCGASILKICNRVRERTWPCPFGDITCVKYMPILAYHTAITLILNALP